MNVENTIREGRHLIASLIRDSAKGDQGILSLHPEFIKLVEAFGELAEVAREYAVIKDQLLNGTIIAGGNHNDDSLEAICESLPRNCWAAVSLEKHIKWIKNAK